LTRRHFGQNVLDPNNQDLTINTAELTVEAATEVVLAGLHQKLTVTIR
jgi:hypothetical protein